MKVSLPVISSLIKDTLATKIESFIKASAGNVVFNYAISIDALTNDLLNNDVTMLKFSLFPKATASPTNDFQKIASGDLSPIATRESKSFSSLSEASMSVGETGVTNESFSDGYSSGNMKNINFEKNRSISKSILKSHMQLKDSIRDNKEEEIKNEINSVIISFDNTISAESKKALLRSKMLASIKSGTGDSISKRSRVSDIFFDGGVKFSQEKNKNTSSKNAKSDSPILDTFLIQRTSKSLQTNVGTSDICYERDSSGNVVQTSGKSNINRTSSQDTLLGDIERSEKRSSLPSSLELNIQSACWSAITRFGLSPSELIPVRVAEFINSASDNREGLSSSKESNLKNDDLDQVSNSLRRNLLRLPSSSPEKLSDLDRESLVTVPFQTTTEKSTFRCNLEVSQLKILDSEEIILVIDLLGEKGRIVETFTSTINHKDNLENLYSVKNSPEVSLSQSEDSVTHLSVSKMDKSTDKIILFKKTIDKFTFSQGSVYEKIQEINVSNSSDSFLTSILSSPGEAFMLRAISVSKGGILGKFKDTVVRPTARSGSELLENNLGGMSITSENMASGILIEVKGITGTPVSIYFLKKNITLGDRKFKPLMPRGVNMTNVTKRVVQLLDTDIFDGHSYEYKCMMIFKNGTEKHSDNSTIIIRRSIVDSIKVNSLAPIVKRSKKKGEYNITLNNSIEIPESSIDKIRDIFDELGLSDLYSDEIQSIKQQFDTISLFSVTRFDVKTGAKYNLGTMSAGQMIDTGDSSRGIPSPIAGSEYIYEFEVLIRTPNGVLSEISTSQSARNRRMVSTLPSVYAERSSENSTSATASPIPVNFPEKFTAPLAIREGTLSYGMALSSNHSGDSFELGRIGVVKTVRVSIPSHDVRITPSVVRLNKSNESIIRWSVKSNIENIDHFVILATRMGMTIPIGTHHSQSERGGFLYIDTTQKDIPGNVKYSIVPILSNFTKGLERNIGSITIPGDA